MQSNSEICKIIGQSSRNKTGARGFFSKAANPCFCTFISTSFIYFLLELLALKMNGAYAVLDLEQSLLDSNFIEPNKLQLLFRPSGKYVASTHFFHIRIPFNFSQLLATSSIIFEQYCNYIEQWPFRMQMEQIAEVSRACITDKINDFINILDALPHHQVVNRHKRFLNLVALGMSMAALTLIKLQICSHINTRIANHVEQQKKLTTWWTFQIFTNNISKL
jgi:hypothetical protein